MNNNWIFVLIFLYCVPITGSAAAEESAKWSYSSELLQPFWQSEVVQSEPILFIKDSVSETAAGRLLFPVDEVLEIRDSSGRKLFEHGVDYLFERGESKITLPADSRIVTVEPDALRRPANSQQFQLTHRDGNGEILFGAKLEYHELQTSVTYRKASHEWPLEMAACQTDSLAETLAKLEADKPLSVVLLGDSISTGCNSSSWGGGAPFQPAFQDLFVQHLNEHYESEITLTNLSVGGTTAAWGVTMVDKVIESTPDLVILAFGMNDSAGRSAADYGADIKAMISGVRSEMPATEIILVASMLGNRDWPRLHQELFPQYREQLSRMTGDGIALADMTSVWAEMLHRKNDSDLTGNGVNHPNDFGHRVYAQVLCSLLVPDAPVEIEAVQCDGDYSGHLQGVCLNDQGSIYWSFTTVLVKTDMQGRIQKRIPVANHHGDLCFNDGRVYVAVNLGKFNDPEGHADSWVYVYDSQTLDRVAAHEVQEVFHGAGGIGVRENQFYVVGGLPEGVEENYVYEYDGDFRFVHKHVIDSKWTELGIQTATYHDGYWWFGCYGKDHPLIKTDENFQMRGRYDFSCSLGIVGVAPQRLWVATGPKAPSGRCQGTLFLAQPDDENGLRPLP